MSNIIRGKDEIAKVENLLNELIHDYDMFFRGYEKVEPTIKRDKVKRELSKVQAIRINNAIVKQKVANITHRFATFQRKWKQIWLQIENGKYKIDKYKMNRNRKKAGKDIENKKEQPMAEKSSNLGNKEKEYSKLLNKYEITQQLLGVNKKLNKEVLMRKLEQQEKMLKKKYKVKGIEFKVVVKNGKATIKPIPIK